MTSSRFALGGHVLKLGILYCPLLIGDTVPAPNSNSLPPLIGPKIPVKSACASFSFTGRSKVGNFAEDLAKTPGPCKYNTTDPSTYKNKAPQYSCQGRTYMPGGEFYGY